ncbi:hypothetical protein ACM79S_25580 [Pseudomonas aeruginosa]|uniref:hypothetical protein n=1 Tax=Pseudomonas aeruginosa TaxID=287 RepID=UPI002A6A73A6|nr:hypothetical protein [Pseudomonas aeruginosa]MDY1247761.1 hypothetical protein [Pseudomonas aeruginosa]HCF9805905.1 hypothetical protein [Pseudomonas aeruginosa]
MDEGNKELGQKAKRKRKTATPKARGAKKGGAFTPLQRFKPSGILIALSACVAVPCRCNRRNSNGCERSAGLVRSI